MRTRKRFLCDVDEVLADFQSPTFEIIGRLLKRQLTQYDYDVWDVFSLFTKEEVELLFTEIERPGFCRSLKPLPGAIDAIKELRQIADVYVVTSPFHSETWVAERDAWLMEHFGFTRKQIVHTSAKYLVEGDAFLDDNPSHVLHWKEEHPDGLAMLWHIPNTRKLPHDDVRVFTWERVIEEVKSLGDRKTVYDLLEEREWQREGEPYQPGNYCLTCGATEAGTSIPKHKDGCALDQILSRYRKRRA
jgi:5'(3')-deoxyribonucleotidase